MTKKDIVKTIAADADLTQLKIKEIVQHTFDEIIETLVRDGKIELRNFGVFKVTKRAARPARNPRTGDPVDVPAKCVVTFKPGKEMQARICELADVPGQGSDTESAIDEAGGTPGVPPVEAHTPTSLPSTPLPSTIAAPRVNPATSAPTEIGASEPETSFNHLTGE